jgi:hypothetical protein
MKKIDWSKPLVSKKNSVVKVEYKYSFNSGGTKRAAIHVTFSDDSSGVFDVPYDLDFHHPEYLLFFIENEKENLTRWINIFSGLDGLDNNCYVPSFCFYNTEQEAKDIGSKNITYITTVKVEFED